MFHPRPIHLDTYGVTCLSQAVTDDDRTTHGPPTDTPQWHHQPIPEQMYDDRVRAIEDQLGISTGDAQAMVDAEDLLAQRPQKRRPTPRSSHRATHSTRTVYRR